MWGCCRGGGAGAKFLGVQDCQAPLWEALPQLLPPLPPHPRGLATHITPPLGGTILALQPTLCHWFSQLPSSVAPRTRGEKKVSWKVFPWFPVTHLLIMIDFTQIQLLAAKIFGCFNFIYKWREGWSTNKSSQHSQSFSEFLSKQQFILQCNSSSWQIKLQL